MGQLGAGSGRLVVSQCLLACERSPPPPVAAAGLGQHSAEILKEAGYGERDIEALYDEGVLYDRYREGAPAAQENAARVTAQ